MMNILYERFPDYVILNGKKKKILTDYKDWLRFYDMLLDDSLAISEKTLIIRSYYLSEISFQDQKDMLFPLIRFFRREIGRQQDDGEEKSSGSKKRLFDYSFDAEFIVSDFYSSYGIDLLNGKTKMHWWKFSVLLDGLPENTEFKKRIVYRNTDAGQIKDIKDRNRIQRIQRKIALPALRPADSDIGDMFW